VTTTVEPLEPQTVLSGNLEVAVSQEDRRYYASINVEPRFYVGTEVRYKSRRGLMNNANPYGPRYEPQEYEPSVDIWAYYLLPTITCESRGAFNCINTYDSARFTYGHMQFAAHTPDANFVLLFRELLRLPAASFYFPDLALHNGFIHQRRDQGLVQLESQLSTQALQDYLNPDSGGVERQEVVVAAKFMDWCARDPQFKETMVRFAFSDQRDKLRGHARNLPLNGLSDKLCLVVLDILHQGRGKYTTIGAALGKNDPFDALLDIGLNTYRERIATLRNGILDLERRGIVGHRVYRNEVGDFVTATEA
jgi:hypothetical protein